MGRKHQFAQHGTGHCASIVMPSRAITPALSMNGRFLRKQPAIPQIIERQVSTASDIGARILTGSSQSEAVVRTPIAARRRSLASCRPLTGIRAHPAARIQRHFPCVAQTWRYPGRFGAAGQPPEKSMMAPVMNVPWAVAR
jgi:hypothetical protein